MRSWTKATIREVAREATTSAVPGPSWGTAPPSATEPSRRSPAPPGATTPPSAVLAERRFRRQRLRGERRVERAPGAGRRVPEEVAIVGFDDVPLARRSSPPPTTVHVPIEALGVRAVDWLLQGVASLHRGERREATLRATRTVRRSCGVPRAGADPPASHVPVPRAPAGPRAGVRPSTPR